MADEVFDPTVLETPPAEEAPAVDPDEAAAELAAALAEEEAAAAPEPEPIPEPVPEPEPVAAEESVPEPEPTPAPEPVAEEPAPAPAPEPTPEPEPAPEVAEAADLDALPECTCEGDVCEEMLAPVDDERWDAADIPLQSRVPGVDPWGDVPMQSRS